MNILNKIINSKKAIIIASLLIAVIAIVTVVTIYFGTTKLEKQTAAQPQEIDEKIAEEPIKEEEKLENNEEENAEQQNEEGQATTPNTTKKETNSNKSKSKNPYYIKVNYGAQVVTIYKQDENGEYTVPVKAMVCSTGSATPKSGVYSIPARWEWLRLQGYVWGHYSTQIKGNILFHSVPYLEKENLSSLEYWEYDKLGTAASAGCVRLTVKDAKWIYDNCAKGTKVEFYSSSNPGPLGKPSAKQISSYPDYLRNWDPTDPNKNNPWRTYKEQSNNNTSKNETTNKIDNTNNKEETNKVDSTTKNDVTNKVDNTDKKEDNTTKNEVTNNGDTTKNELTNKGDNTNNKEETNKGGSTTKGETTNKVDNTTKKEETNNVNNIIK